MSRSRLLLDTGVLLIFVVGSVSPLIIRHHKKLDAFDAADYDLLKEVMADATEIVTTPNCWTEVSNQIEYGVPGEWRGGLRHQLKERMLEMREHYVASSQCAGDHAFYALGVSDVGLLQALNNETALLTIDAPLYEQARSRGYDAENFHHVREARGLV